MILVDDHLLAKQLSGELPVATGPNDLATTCTWWWRLASAVTGSRQGSLSRRLGADFAVDTVAVEVLFTLPDRVAMIDRRDLVPNMARVAARYRLSLLAAEALVAAEALGADIVVGQDTPRLREAARVRGITYLVEA